MTLTWSAASASEVTS